MTFTVAQITDTHLGARSELFRANFQRLVSALGDARPDLVVATGDQTLDGADSDADMALAARLHAALPGPVRFIPGNHDVGDHPEAAPKQPVTDARLARFTAAMGPARWVEDRDGWRLLGLNSQVMGAHPDEHAQAAMIEEALATLGERRLAVFIHKPLFQHDPDETVFDYWSVPPFARGAVRALMAHPALRLVASGHLHVHHAFTRGAVRYVWAPSAAFVVREALQEGMPGARPTGALLHRFGADSVETVLVDPPGMGRPWFPDIRDQTYPPAA